MTSTDGENASSTMPGSTVNFQPNQFTSPEVRSASDYKAVVVGLYGVPGSGKTVLLKQLEEKLEQKDFAFYEAPR